MDIRKANKGDALNIPANAYNAFVEAALHHKGSTGAKTRDAKERSPLNSAVVTVMNDSGAAQAQFAVLQISAPVILPADNEQGFKERMVLKVITPDADGAGRWVVLQQPLGVNEFGPAIAVGVSVCKINLTDEAHTCVESVDGNVIPDSGAAGSGQILWVAGGVGTADDTGEQLSVIRLGGGGSSGDIDVFTTQNGGTNGDPTTPASYAYDCEDMKSGTVYTAIAANFQRPNGRMLPALIGRGRLVDGGFILDWADEVPYTQACTPPE